jgi:LPS sulfotransferase NodH
MNLISDKVKKEYYSYLISMIKSMPKKKFILFGQGRSGSTLLIDLLNSHPKIKAHREILNTSSSAAGNVIPYKYPYRYVKGVASRCEKEVYGYKTKIYQVEGHGVDPEKFIRRHVDDGWSIIYLWRMNLMNQAISGAKAAKTDIWHQKKGDEEKVNVTIEPENVLERVKFRKKKIKEERKILRELDVIEVAYERDLKNIDRQRSTCEKIFEYMGIDEHKVNTNFEKMKKIKINNEEKIKKFVEDKVDNFIVEDGL